MIKFSWILSSVKLEKLYKAELDRISVGEREMRKSYGCADPFKDCFSLVISRSSRNDVDDVILAMCIFD